MAWIEGALGVLKSPLGGAIVSGAGSLLGGIFGGQGAEQGAQTQADAMRQSAELQKQMFDIQNQQQAPYREAGYSALSDIGNMKPYLTHQFGAQDFQQGIDPGYAFRLQQGQRALQGQQNAAGGLIGGNALAAMQDYTQGQASQEYQNAFNRYQTQRGNIYNSLASIAGLGQTSLGQTGQLAGQTAQGVGNAIAGAGSALGAGQVAMNNALGGGIQGAGNAYMLSQLLGQRNPLATTPATNSYSGANLDYMGGGQGLRLPNQ
jgi:hypothetical protein